MKQCFKCKIKKPLDKFYRHPGMSDGRLGKCIECAKEDVANNRLLRRDYYNSFDVHRHRNNILRLWKQKYKLMRKRTSGTSNHSNLLGKELLPKEEFIEWCEGTKAGFMELHRKWAKSGYTRRTAPSIDRIDNDRGYTTDNMQWITQSENSRKYNK